MSVLVNVMMSSSGHVTQSRSVFSLFSGFKNLVRIKLISTPAVYSSLDDSRPSNYWKVSRFKRNLSSLLVFSRLRPPDTVPVLNRITLVSNQLRTGALLCVGDANQMRAVILLRCAGQADRSLLTRFQM